MVEYTLHSRMRRAMTCVYCEPKSRMTICSFIENEGEVFACDEQFWREENRSLSRQRPCASHLRRPGQRLPINRSRRRQSALTTQSARTDVRGYDVHGKPRFVFPH